MKRLREEFLNEVENVIPLKGKKILEIGCGVGNRSTAIAERCEALDAVEPDAKSMATAQEANARENIRYQQASAEKLPFEENKFDVVMFTLSFHHVPFGRMAAALDEAVRVTKKHGYVVFLEPVFEGTYFNAEILFGASDGDERKEKTRAYFEILNYPNYEEVAEIDDETSFQLDSIDDFVKNLHPKKNLEEIENFLMANNFILNAKRRINIFRV